MSRLQPLLSVSIGHGVDINEIITIPPGFTVYRVAYYADLNIVPDNLYADLLFNGRAFSGEKEVVDFLYSRKQTRYSFCVQLEGDSVYNAKYDYGPADPYFNCLGIVNKTTALKAIPEDYRTVICLQPRIAQGQYMNPQIPDAFALMNTLRSEGTVINNVVLNGKLVNELTLRDLFTLYKGAHSHVYIILWSCRSSKIYRSQNTTEPRLIADRDFYLKNPRLTANSIEIYKSKCSEIKLADLNFLNKSLQEHCHPKANICIKGDSRAIAVSVDREPVSFLTIDPVFSGGDLKLFVLYNVCTIVPARNLGFSRLLLNHAFYHILSNTSNKDQNYIFLFPDPKNGPALTKMYAKYGFTPVAEYVDDDSDVQRELVKQYYDRILPLNHDAYWMVYHVAFQKRISSTKIVLS